MHRCGPNFMVLGKGQKLKIDGIKLSNELLAIKLTSTSDTSISVSGFCHVLAKEKINMPFLSIDRSDKGCVLTCCVDKEDAKKTRELILKEFPEVHEDIQFIPQVGLLSIFPHQSSLKLLGATLAVFARAEIPFFAVASSLSVLAFVTLFPRLDELVELFEEYLNLPSDHVPLRQEIRVKQTDIIPEGD